LTRHASLYYIKALWYNKNITNIKKAVIMALKKISLENFTVFEKMGIELCGGINVFVGENGTGKTHLLKVLYVLCECEIHEVSDVSPFESLDFAAKISGCFQTKLLGDLIKNNLDTALEVGISTIGVTTNTNEHVFSIKTSIALNASSMVLYGSGIKNTVPAVFIPAKEMLTHSGLEKDFTQRNLPFDTTLIDILNKAGVSTVKKLPDNMLAILDKIAQVIGGKVLFENNHYYVLKPNGSRIDFAVEAEGFKKLGLLYRLIETGNIAKGSVLIWDEPESNINPKNIPVIVDLLLDLQKSGVQIFVATHDYFFAKYLDVKKKKDDDILYHALYKSGDTVLHECERDFAMLENNTIIKQSIELYKDEVKKVME